MAKQMMRAAEAENGNSCDLAPGQYRRDRMVSAIRAEEGEGRKVIGKITRAWVENGRGQAEVEFDEDAESDAIYKKVKSGSLKGMSVGYMVNMKESEDVRAGKKSEDGRFTGPCRIMKMWQPFEISIVSIPADSTVGVGRDWDGPEFSPSGETPQLARRATLTAPLSVYEQQLQINKNIIGGM
ncbi:caudovirus prohead protease [Acutalibacter sp. 1XD8-33]|uniref:HK97 family phage prohead protease n=1 Tax=Acutalibacter sp. 1XD8-33 TaxID=2320081 RepID=UPI000EA02956|nr:HK97 family phage prohead protease [Acutalibacter sp. 1XD8-33]RKJ39239.1 caudovirus prohead protease [Acutalibacter sp. 1XD8-33]